MCVVSMVMDSFSKRIPSNNEFPWSPQPSTLTTVNVPSKEDLDKLQKLIEDFHKTVEAARLIDKFMNQPDCVDPEKAKLEARVANLEKVVGKLLLEREAAKP